MMTAVGVRGSVAIAGIGITEMGKVYGKTATGFAADAIALALDDDGLLIHSNASTEMNTMLQMSLGFTDLTLINAMSAFGSTSGGMVHYAAAAIEAGQAEVVVLVYADAPLKPKGSAGASYARQRAGHGMGGLYGTYGLFGANHGYAMAARRHMDLYGTTSEQLGA